MAWDEKVYGREYDLDQFNIVAVSDFNMGAMENKSLNIFNSAYVLADHDTATDADFDNIARVVAHEYFHNWSGDRVTCRDWFQLSLKEGFTVFRDQSFSADTGSPAVKRIDDVRVLRAAHPANAAVAVRAQHAMARDCEGQESLGGEADRARRAAADGPLRHCRGAAAAVNHPQLFRPDHRDGDPGRGRARAAGASRY